MLTCQEVAGVVTDYLEGRMGITRRLQFRFHLFLCGSCRQHIHKMRTLVLALGQIPPEDIPPEVVESFRTWKSPAAPQPRT